MKYRTIQGKPGFFQVCRLFIFPLSVPTHTFTERFHKHTQRHNMLPHTMIETNVNGELTSDHHSLKHLTNNTKSIPLKFHKECRIINYFINQRNPRMKESKKKYVRN